MFLLLDNDVPDREASPLVLTRTAVRQAPTLSWFSKLRFCDTRETVWSSHFPSCLLAKLAPFTLPEEVEVDGHEQIGNS
jgi:hypothetical protein